jgi:zinc transport system ATP-binding protein
MSTEGNNSKSSQGELLLRCERLIVGYRGVPLLPPLDIGIRRGELLLVVGRNGAGKSTWLKTMLGLLPAVDGTLREYGSSAGKALQKVYVPQSAALDELLPVRADTVVGWGQLRGWDFLRPLARATERRARTRALEQAEAGGFGKQQFAKLSGGQRQRILFARLLAGSADVAFLDEPTASMDIASENQAYGQMAALAREHGMAVVVVTHTISTAARYADKVLFVDRGSGRGHGRGTGVVEYGPPETVFQHSTFQYHFGDIAIDHKPDDEVLANGR